MKLIFSISIIIILITLYVLLISHFNNFNNKWLYVIGLLAVYSICKIIFKKKK